MKKKKGYQFTKQGVSVDDHDESFKQGKNAGSYPSKPSIQKAGHEMKENPPKQLAKTARKFGKKKAKKQKIAIMLNKARSGG